jgi:hypothetical protein
MSITTDIEKLLNDSGPVSVEGIAASIPELNRCGGSERAFLLLCLNSKFEEIKKEAFPVVETNEGIILNEDKTSYLSKSKWITRGSGKSDEEAIHDAAHQYFKSLGKPGAPIANVVMEVTKTTGLSAPAVEQALRSQFMTMNTNIFNQPKRQEDKS